MQLHTESYGDNCSDIFLVLAQKVITFPIKKIEKYIFVTYGTCDCNVWDRDF